MKTLDNKMTFALSYWNSPEITQDSIREIKYKNNHTQLLDTLNKRRTHLIQPVISNAIHELYDMVPKYMTAAQFKEEKAKLIKHLNDMWFHKRNEAKKDGKKKEVIDNEYGITITNGRTDKRGFHINFYAKDAKEERRVDKGYVNQNTPNKYTFFQYNMSDLYNFIEEYVSDEEDYKFNLSQHAKDMLEQIINHEVENFKKSADEKGLVQHHTIAHGVDYEETIVKFIEKYINSRKNPHIKDKFYLSSDARSKIIEILKNETKKYQHGLNDYLLDQKLKSSNILDKINNMWF